MRLLFLDTRGGDTHFCFQLKLIKLKQLPRELFGLFSINLYFKNERLNFSLLFRRFGTFECWHLLYLIFATWPPQKSVSQILKGDSSVPCEHLIAITNPSLLIPWDMFGVSKFCLVAGRNPSISLVLKSSGLVISLYLKHANNYFSANEIAITFSTRGVTFPEKWSFVLGSS